MHNSKYQCHMAACCTITYQLTSPSCKTGAVQKKPVSERTILKDFLGKVQNGPAGRKEKKR